MEHPLHISDIQLYNLLKKKLGEQEAEQLVNFVKSEVGNLSEKKYEFISKDIGALRDELYKNFATKEDIAKAEPKLILWAFVFWATQLVSVFTFLKFLVK
jgi:hypothetical protein